MTRLSLLLFPVLLLGACSDLAPAPVTHYGLNAGAGSAGVHIVKLGDTLWSISNRYKIVMRDIANVNNLSAPFSLDTGQRLKLPPPQNYTVKDGDTLYSVSRLFGVNMNEIARLNALRSPYVVASGDVLRMPSLTHDAMVARNEAVVTPLSKPGYVGARPGVKPTVKKSRVFAQVPKRSSSRFQRPVEGKILSSYGAKAGGLHNDGINIAAVRGAPVRAAENGVVVYAGNELKGSGNLVLVRHEGRWMTAYAHMDKTLIKRGQVIKRGQTIGTVGSTGSVSTPQLHFEVRRGTEAINPARYLEG